MTRSERKLLGALLKVAWLSMITVVTFIEERNEKLPVDQRQQVGAVKQLREAAHVADSMRSRF